ncbi:MAG: hypothetical protein J6Y72_01230 [Bacteroidales bacterium]|nr:hypothetical protein [Bacteroidales bacterium]
MYDKNIRLLVLGYKDFGIYGKYCPIRLFESGRGPINQSFTIGLKWNW